MASEMLLYDLPSKGRCACWTPNPWKTRIALNYKGIPYKTQFLEYPDVEPTLKPLGIAPNEVPPANAAYTIPTVRFDDGAVVMDSRKIAAELEKRHPSPSLHLDSPYLPKVEEILGKIFPSLVPVFMPRIARNLVTPASIDKFNADRAKRFGMSLDELEKAKGGEPAWENAKPHLEQMAQTLNENSEGPFFMGKTVSYADFVLVTFFKAMHRADPSLLDRVVTYDDAFAKLFEACGKWMEKDT